MTNTTIADIVREKVVLDNTEWFEGQDGTGSFKSRVASIRGFGVVDVTSTITPTDIGPDPQLILITTSGSAGPEIVNLVDFPLDGNGEAIDKTGSRLVVALAHATDPSDTINITYGGGTMIYTADPPALGTRARIRTGDPGVELLGEGDCAVFIWQVDQWAWDRNATGNWARANFQHDAIYLEGVSPTTGSGGQLFVFGGNSADASGGDVSVRGGDGAINGGPVIVSGGSPTAAGSAGSATLTGGNSASSGQGGSAYVTGGNSASGDAGWGVVQGGQSATTGSGGVAQLQGGYGFAHGGNVQIDGGAADDAANNGLILIGTNTPIPTADPHVAGALYTVAGVLHVSAG